MTNLEVYQLSKSLNQTSFRNVQNGTFNYALMKNKKKLTKESKLIQDTVELMKCQELQDLEKTLRPLIDKAVQQYAMERKLSSISEVEGQMIQQEVLSECTFRKRYETLMKEHLENSKPFEGEKSDFRPYYIKSDLIESLPLNDEQMDIIWPLIKHVEENTPEDAGVDEVS